MSLTTDEKAILKDAVALITRETDNDGDKITLKGFGSFSRKAMAARTARNPKTGEPISVPARSVLKFKASKGTTEYSA